MTNVQERREMREACEIQRRLLPDLVHVSGVEIFVDGGASLLR